MKVAVIGSRGLHINNIESYLPKETTELVSGGAKGIDSCIQLYADKNRIPIKVFLPEYDKFGRAAPIIRNIKIIEYSDNVIAIWNGKSRGTKFVIDECTKRNKPCKVYICN